MYDADIVTNVVCIALTFKYFNGYYDKLCSCCHGKCHRLWDKCIRRRERKSNISMHVQQQSDQATSDVCSSPTAQV